MIYPPTLYGSKIDEDLQEFIAEVSKILMDMGLSTSEKVELSTYKLKDLAQQRYVQCRNNRPLRGGPLTWQIFKMTYLDRFLHRDMRE